MQLFYYSHIFGALVFMVFGTMHHSHTWLYAAAGLVIYGIDLAYRVYQTSLPVTVEVSGQKGSNIISMRIPVKVRPSTSCAPCRYLTVPCTSHSSYVIRFGAWLHVVVGAGSMHVCTPGTGIHVCVCMHACIYTHACMHIHTCMHSACMCVVALQQLGEYLSCPLTRWYFHYTPHILGFVLSVLHGEEVQV
jgi:hypothetical protein